MRIFGSTGTTVQTGSLDEVVTDLDDLDGITTAGVANNDVLVYNNSNTRFEPKKLVLDESVDLTAITGYSAGNQQFIVSDGDGTLSVTTQVTLDSVVDFTALSGYDSGKPQFLLSDGDGTVSVSNTFSSLSSAQTPTMQSVGHTTALALQRSEASGLSDGDAVYLNMQLFDAGTSSTQYIAQLQAVYGAGGNNDEFRITVVENNNFGSPTNYKFMSDKFESEVQGEFFNWFQVKNNGGNPQLYITRIDTHGSNQTIGTIQGWGRDDGGNFHHYTSIDFTANDDTNGSEDGSIKFFTSVNGSLTEIFSIAETLTASEQFRVTHETDQADVQLFRAQSVSDGDPIGQITFHTEDSGSNIDRYCGIRASAVDVTAGTEDGKITVFCQTAGSDQDVIDFTSEKVEVKNVPFKLSAFASGSMPTGEAGMMVAVSNNNYRPAYYSGSAWLYVHDNSAV